MSEINFNISHIKKQAKLLDEAAVQLNNSVKTIDSANDEAAKAWSGNASASFQKYMRDINVKLGTNVTAIKQIAAALREACDSMSKAENQVKSKVNKIK